MDISKLKEQAEVRDSNISAFKRKKTTGSINHLLNEELDNKNLTNSDRSAVKTNDEYFPPFSRNNKKVVANHQQSGSKAVAKCQQSSSKVIAKTGSDNGRSAESDSKVVAQPVAKVIANYQQSNSKVVAKTSVQQLSGLQYDLLKILYFSCRNVARDYTQPLSIQYLKDSLKTTSGTVKNAIHRLIQKNFITKHSFKNGRGGWTQYRLEKHTYSEMLQNESDSKLVANYQQSSSKVVAKLVAQPVASSTSGSSSSSISNINKETTPTEDNSMPREWKEINTPQNLKAVGFGLSQIRQIWKMGKFQAQEIQLSLDAFSYDLTENRVNAKSGPLNFFMGILRKENLYISSQYLEETQKEVNEYSAKLKQFKAAQEKLKEIEEQKQFEDWLETISDERKDEIAPPSGIIESGSIFQTAMLKDYWKQKLGGNDENSKNTQ